MRTQYRDAILYGALIIGWGVAGWLVDRGKEARSLRETITPRVEFARRHVRDAMIREEFNVSSEDATNG